MNAINPPRLHGKAIGSALCKALAADFQVDEILGFDPSGEGEHCFVWLEKTNRNSNDVATQLANRLGIRKRLVSHCGLKDKNAVTRQWFSLHLPGQKSPVAVDLEGNGVRILKITRNFRKLHRGSHDGNRFAIRLREVTFSKAAATQRWQQITKRGVPNYFGPQRFGRDGGNVEQAGRFLSGAVKIRDRALRSILISAARSLLFNACIAIRVQRGIWDTPLAGDVFGFANSRSLVLPENLRGDEPERLHRGTLELTAPLWGEGALHSQGSIRGLEQEVAEHYSELATGLVQLGLKQDRRVIRLTPNSPAINWESDATLVVRFSLPKGTYATTLIRELADLKG
jgi:tRNA pseudouridine13 synthase